MTEANERTIMEIIGYQTADPCVTSQVIQPQSQPARYTKYCNITIKFKTISEIVQELSYRGIKNEFKHAVMGTF